MPRCIVYGPRDIDVVGLINQNFQKAFVTKFDDSGDVTAVFPEDPTEMLNRLGVHVIVLDRVSTILKQPILIRPAFGVPNEAEARIKELLQKRFMGRAVGRGRFEIPLPMPTAKDEPDEVKRHKLEFELRMEAIKSIEDFMHQNGIRVEIGLARW